MKTEELNDYIFAKLVDDFAQKARQQRITQLEQQAKAAGKKLSDDIYDAPVNDEDLCAGLELLQQRRLRVDAMLSKVHPEPD